MLKFYFDIADHETYVDETGAQFADGGAARTAAVIFAGQYLKDHPDLIWDGRRVSIHVRQEDGAVVFSVVVLAVDTPPHVPKVVPHMKLATLGGERT